MNVPVLRVDGISKSFGPIQVFSEITINVGRNEVVGLAGENGAGKSTILKAIAGVLTPNTGSMSLQGARYAPRSYSEAVESGVFMVFQEQALLPNMKVYENIFFTHEDRFRKTGLGMDVQRMKEQAQTKLKQLGLSHINAGSLTAELPFHERQMLEIGKAFILADIFGVEHPIILLDEPTAAIGENEVRLLFEAIARLRHMASFVIVTHKLSEYKELCDRIYILKDGALVGELDRSQIEEDRIHQLMVGRERNDEFYQEQRQRSEVGPIRLSIQGLSGNGVRDLSFSIGQGEILGIGGLVGSGKEEVVRAIVGHEPFPLGGTVSKDKYMLPNKRRGPFANKVGIGYVPKERKSEGIVPLFSVAQNISLASLPLVSSFGKIISPRLEQQLASKFIKSLRIKTAGPDQEITRLSGGNQQKVVLARWLARNVDVLVLESPTRGVDVGAKEEIFSIIRDLTIRGVSILLVTDDLLELIGLSNRILVMREGRITVELPAPKGRKPTEQDVVKFMV